MCQVVKNLAHSRTLLRIGVATMRGNTIFPKLHGAFLKEHPRTTIETIEETTNVLYELLDRQEIDFALCVTNHMPEEPYHHLLLRKSYLKLFVRKDHPLASRTSLSLKELKDVPLVMFSDHFDQTTYIKRMFAVSEVQPRIVHQTSQVFTILEYIRSEAAAGFLTEEIASQEPDLAAIPITEFHPAFITLVWNKNVRLHPAMEEFIRFVKQSRFIQPLEPPQKAEPSSSKNKKAFSSCCSWRRLFLGNLFPNGLHDFFVSLAHFLGNQVEQGIEHIPIDAFVFEHYAQVQNQGTFRIQLELESLVALVDIGDHFFQGFLVVVLQGLGGQQHPNHAKSRVVQQNHQDHGRTINIYMGTEYGGVEPVPFNGLYLKCFRIFLVQIFLECLGSLV